MGNSEVSLRPVTLGKCIKCVPLKMMFMKYCITYLEGDISFPRALCHFLELLWNTEAGPG